jgi:hypothetical protein
MTTGAASRRSFSRDGLRRLRLAAWALAACAAGLAGAAALCSGSAAGGLARALALLGVLAAVGVAAASLRRHTAPPSDAKLAVVERHALSGDTGVAIAAADGRRLLLGYGPSGVALLAELAPAAPERLA